MQKGSPITSTNIASNINSNNSPVNLPSNYINISSNNLSQMDQKINNLLDSVQKVLTENQKLKPLLKTIVDMQFFTFQKIKKYQETIDDLKMKLNHTPKGKEKKQNLRRKEEDNAINLSPDKVSNMDDDELYSLLETQSNPEGKNKSLKEKQPDIADNLKQTSQFLEP